MSRPKVLGVLNRMFTSQCFSLVNYVSEAPPWRHRGNEPLMEALHGIVHDHEHYAQRLASAIDECDGCVDLGSFPMAFTSLNDLAPDYLLARLIEYQHRDIQATEQCVAELDEDTLAQNLVSEILGSERAHLDILNEFLPQTGTAFKGDEIYQAA